MVHRAFNCSWSFLVHFPHILDLRVEAFRIKNIVKTSNKYCIMVQYLAPLWYVPLKDDGRNFDANSTEAAIVVCQSSGKIASAVVCKP
jgi:hypothetical protein